jgi:hypothetical protein
MWGNPMRERESLLLCSRKVQNKNKITFPSKENTSQHQNCPTKICIVFCAKTVLLSSLFYLIFCAHIQLYRLFRMAQKQRTKKLIPPKNLCQKSPRFLCQIYTAIWTIWNHTDYMDPYSTTSHSRKNISAKNSQKKFVREMCPHSSKNMLSLLLTFLSQSCSENLSNSLLDVISTSS